MKLQAALAAPLTLCVIRFSVFPPGCTKHLGTYSDKSPSAEIARVRHPSLGALHSRCLKRSTKS